MRIDAVLLEVSAYPFSSLTTGNVLPAAGLGGHVLRGLDGGQNLGLLGTQLLGVEARRLLHGGQGHEL